MWYANNKEFTPEQEFIFQVQMLAQKYDVEVEIDYKLKIVNFLTEDDRLQVILAKELSEIFCDNAF